MGDFLLPQLEIVAIQTTLVYIVMLRFVFTGIVFAY